MSKPEPLTAYMAKLIEFHLTGRTKAVSAKCDAPAIGDYVLATKYSDGDPGDHYCVGFYNGGYDHFGQTRHLVVDNNGNNFRANGFRRAEKITHDEGVYMISQFSNFVPLEIEEVDDGEDRLVGKSVWDWLYEKRKRKNARKSPRKFVQAKP